MRQEKKSDIEELFERYPILKLINEKHKGIMEQGILFKELMAGEYIKTGDSQCNDLLFVMQGQLKIEKVDENGRVMKMYELGPGEICHEVLSCYMRCQTLYLSGKAITDMKVAFIPMRKVNEYIIQDYDFMKFMYTNLYDKFRKVILDKEEILHESVASRLIKYLKNKNSNTIYITHQELAFELGTAREVVSRNLKVLEKEGRIRLERNRIKIVNLD